MSDLLQMDLDEEEVPALVGVGLGVGGANSDEDSETTHLQDSSVAKVPLTIVTGTTQDHDES